MIRLTLDAAEFRAPASNRAMWSVVLPQNGAILAYCDTRKEAELFVSFLVALGSIVRQVS